MRLAPWLICLALIAGCSAIEDRVVDLSERSGQELGALLAEKLRGPIGDSIAQSSHDLARAIDEQVPDENTPWYATAALAALYAIRKGYVKRIKKEPGEV